jgi:tRNA(His) 5'-end guanylyltransferase
MERKNKMKKDSLGDRMKQYEGIPKTNLMRRNPVIIRIDGKAFHTFTRGFQRPFDNILIESMQETMKYLCENIQGCKLGYCQSDEISLLLTDYETINTAAWFDYQVQKMCSIAASMATLAFNRAFDEKVEQEYMSLEAEAMFPSYPNSDYIKEQDNIYKAHEKAFFKGAMFDARCFSIPKEEVCNYFIWRQQDATRNSIQMVGQANFSHKELQNKSCDKIQDMLMLERNINWNDFDTVKKRGSCCTKTGKHTVVNLQTNEQVERLTWEIDTEIPIFTQDRNYVERFV